MRLGLIVIQVNEDNLTYARQLGVEHVIVPIPVEEAGAEGYYDFDVLIRLRTRIEAAGLKLNAIHNIPSAWYTEARYNLPGRDRQIENFQKTIMNVGRAGIPMIGYQFHAVRVWRTSYHSRDRGGAQVTSYDHSLMQNAPLYGPREIGDDELWEHFLFFLEKIMPVAEEYGVKMALHPDDPPMSPIAGAACIMRSVEAFQRVIDAVPSESNGVLFCQGCFAEMGSGVYDAIRHFGRQKKIFYVHFRNVAGAVPEFAETFIDNGDVDMLEAMRAYKEVGYDGLLLPDHLPRMVGDTPYQHRSRAYAVGYIKALMAAVNAG